MKSFVQMKSWDKNGSNFQYLYLSWELKLQKAKYCLSSKNSKSKQNCITRRHNGNNLILVLPSFLSLSLPLRKSPSSFGNLDIHELSLTIGQIYEKCNFWASLQSTGPLVPTKKREGELLVHPLLTLLPSTLDLSLYVIYWSECFSIQIGKFDKNSSVVKYNSYMIGSQYRLV